MSNYMVMARKAGEHFFLIDNATVATVGDWRTGAIGPVCRRIELGNSGPLDLKLIGMPSADRDIQMRALSELLKTGPVNIGLTTEGSDGLLRFVIYFPDEATLRMRMGQMVLFDPE